MKYLMLTDSIFLLQQNLKKAEASECSNVDSHAVSLHKTASFTIEECCCQRSEVICTDLYICGSTSTFWDNVWEQSNIWKSSLIRYRHHTHFTSSAFLVAVPHHTWRVGRKSHRHNVDNGWRINEGCHNSYLLFVDFSFVRTHIC